MKIIGLEFRMQVRRAASGHYDRREILILPLDIDLPIPDDVSGNSIRLSFPCTIHTDRGDISFGDEPINFDPAPDSVVDATHLFAVR